jgi:hypothetical protein
MFYRLPEVKFKVILPNGCGACLQDRSLRTPGGTNPGPGRCLGRTGLRHPANSVESDWEPVITSRTR